MPETRKFSIHEVREALEKHTGEKIEDLEIEDEQGNKVRGGLGFTMTAQEKAYAESHPHSLLGEELAWEETQGK